MRIEFDPTNREEATAVRAVLNAIHGPEWTEKVVSRTVSLSPGPVDAQALTEVGERIAETQKLHSEDGGMTVNLTDGTVTVATDTDSVPDLDANNEPHDPRIHSTPAKTNADGTWRAKRGVTAEQVAAVRAERTAPVGLIDNMTDEELSEDRSEENPNVGAPVQEQSAPPAPNAPVEEQPVSAAPKPPGQSEAPLAPAATQTAPADTVATTPSAPVAPSDAPVSFLDVMKAITAAQKDGHVTTAKVKELCAAIGAGDSTMGLNGADKGELRVQFMALLDGEVGQ